MLFKEIIAAYSKNHMKLINKICRQNTESLIVKPGSMYIYKILRG
jgi:hypothetical protein